MILDVALVSMRPEIFSVNTDKKGKLETVKEETCVNSMSSHLSDCYFLEYTNLEPLLNHIFMANEVLVLMECSR